MLAVFISNARNVITCVGKNTDFLDEYENLDLLEEALFHEYCLGSPYMYLQLIRSHQHILLTNGLALPDKKKVASEFL